MKNDHKNNSKPSRPQYKRRRFLKTTLISGMSMFCLPLSSNKLKMDKKDELTYDLDLDIPTRLFDGKFCWSHTRAGIIPGIGAENLPRVVMTMNKLDLSGSDVFRGIFGFETDNLGKTWTSPEEVENLTYRTEKIEGISRPVAVSDFWPKWHKSTGKLLGIGHTVAYTPDWKVTRPRPRSITYSFYCPEKHGWLPWKKLKMPSHKRFQDCGAGSCQRYDMPDGNILLPVGFHPDPLGKNGSITVVRCSLDDMKLSYLEHGNEISINDKTRGLYEPSLTYYNNQYFLTIRHDLCGFVAKSQDGLNFSPIQPWKFDDGTDLGNYNTQQHWVTHSDGLFLVYTRRGANNNHVFRHRAPLFIAQVNPESLEVIRNTEQVLVPERGARLGNFGVTDINENETWITVAEWMQPKGVEKYGSDGSIFIARIHWNKPNNLFIN